MIFELLIGQLFLIVYNVANAHIDAYRILSNKTIAHAVNFIAYAIITGALCFLLSLPLLATILFSLSAFFNRQFSFDIPLNLRRGLKWDYQSAANPPKAVLDKIERALFGAGDVGKQIAIIYLSCYCIIIYAWIWIL